MTSQSETQTITINILPDISKSKDNKTMKFGQLIEHNAENEAGRLVSDPFFFFKKSFM